MNIFLTSQASNVLEKIVSMLPNKTDSYRVVFVPTAANPYTSAAWMLEDRDKLELLGLHVEDLDLDICTNQEAKAAVENADIVFVAGGNTFYLLEKVKKVGFDEILRTAVSNGKVYIGSSAGSVLAAPDIEYVELFDDKTKSDLESTTGVGLVDFAVLPHTNNPKYKELHEKVLDQYKDAPYKIVPITDNQFVIPKDLGWEVITV